MKSFFNPPTKDLAQYLPFEFAEFEQYRDEWVTYWRGLGTINAAGVFEPPVSYFEALVMPSRKLHVFMALDDMLVKLAKQKDSKNAIK